MELKNFKSLCLMMAFVISVCSSANVVSFGVELGNNLIAEIAQLAGEDEKDVQSLIDVIGIDKYEDIGKFLNKDGTINIMNFPGDIAFKIKQWAQDNKYNVSLKGGKGSLSKNSKTISTEQLANILFKENNSTGLTSSNSYVDNTGSNNSNSTAAPTNSNMSIADGLFTYDNQLTNSPMVSSFVLAPNSQGAKIDAEKMVEKLLNSTQQTSVILNVPNARWAIESSSLDENAIKGYQFDPGVCIKSLQELDSTSSNVLKSIIDGKKGKVISWAEKNGEVLPFNTRVLVLVDGADALKDFDIYYVVSGQTYNLGRFKLDSKGQIMINFKVIGDFILIEHK